MNSTIDRLRNEKASSSKVHKSNTSIAQKNKNEKKENYNNNNIRSKSRKKDLNIISKIIFGSNAPEPPNKYDKLINELTAFNKNLSNIKQKYVTINEQPSTSSLNNINNNNNNNSNTDKKNTDYSKKKMNLSITNSKENLLFNTKSLISPKGSFNIKKNKLSFVGNPSNNININVLNNDYNNKVNKSNALKSEISTNLTDTIFPQLFARTKIQQYFPKDISRPFSSVMSSAGKNNYSKNSLRIVQPLNSHFLSNMIYLYKAPSNNGKTRPFSHVQKSTTFEASNPFLSSNFSLFSNRRLDSEFSHKGSKKTNKGIPTLLSFDYSNGISVQRKHDKSNNDQGNDDTNPSQMENIDEIEQDKENLQKNVISIQRKSRKSNGSNNINDSNDVNLYLKTSNSNLNTNPNVDSVNTTNISQIKSTLTNKLNSKSKKLNINYIKTKSINFDNINFDLSNIKNESNSAILSKRSKHSQIPISIYILSSYNIYNNQIGLTEIELFDKKGKIPIIEASANSSYIEGGINKNNNTKNIMNLFNGNCYTTSEKDMWVSTFYPDLKIDILIDSSYTLDSISIWNYNGKEINKGVKNVEIYRKNVLIWKGQINKGCFNTKIDYSTKIKINKLLFDSNDKNDTDETTSIYNINRNKYYSARKAFYHSTNSLNSARNKIPQNSNPFANSNSMNSTLNNNNFNISSSGINSRFNSNFDSNNLNNTNEPNSNYSYEKTALRTSIGKSSQEISELTQKKYDGKIISCNKIKIVLTSNYGHRKFIGLTGVQFLDENSEPINIETASSIGALPKDVNTYYNEINDQRIFENVFNCINNTTDENQMWLTVIKKNEPLPYFELFFDQPINLSTIRIYNYNSPLDLDKCTKTIDIYIDDHLPNCPLYIQNIILHKGVADDNVGYYQDICFPIKTKFEYSEKELEPFKTIKTASFLYSQCYETPYLPTGFVIKISLMSNYGDKDNIGIDKIKIYDQLGRDIFHKYKTKYRVEANSLIINDFNDNNGCLLRYMNTNSKDGEHYKENSIFFFFKIPISISYISIKNYRKKKECGVKDIKIYSDDNIIFEGIINQSDAENESDKNGGETLILFTCDMEITKNLDENLLSRPINKTNIAEVKTKNYTSMDLYL